MLYSTEVVMALHKSRANEAEKRRLGSRAKAARIRRRVDVALLQTRPVAAR
jgi:hypothetical protein